MRSNSASNTKHLTFSHSGAKQEWKITIRPSDKRTQLATDYNVSMFTNYKTVQHTSLPHALFSEVTSEE